MMQKAKKQKKIETVKNEVIENVVEEEISVEKASIINEKPVTDEVSEDGFDLNSFQVSKSKGTRKDVGKGAGALSVVNSSNGMRVTVGAAVYGEIGSPDKLQFAFSENEVAVFASLPDNDNYFEPRGKGKGKKALIYSAGLVREMTERYSLDFEGISMLTFYDVRYVENNGVKIAIIRIRD